MGRPLNHRYFGDLNPGATGQASQTGGEGFASVAAVTGLSGMTYLTGGPYTILAADIGAPQIAGGIKPTLTFQPTSATAGTVTVVTPGTGYTSAPTITVRGSLASGSGTATPTVTLTTTVREAIAMQAFVTGGSNRTTGNDIVRQVGSKRFLVRTSDGTGVCKLVQATPAAAGEMAITATDASSKTYYVRKITSRLVTLTQYGTAGHLFSNGTQVKWTIGSAASGVVSIASA